MATIDASRGRRLGREVPTYTERALLVWPRLDRDRLRRARDDPLKIARLVARRTSLSIDEILGLLTGPPRR